MFPGLTPKLEKKPSILRGIQVGFGPLKMSAPWFATKMASWYQQQPKPGVAVARGWSPMGARSKEGIQHVQMAPKGPAARESRRGGTGSAAMGGPSGGGARGRGFSRKH